MSGSTEKGTSATTDRFYAPKRAARAVHGEREAAEEHVRRQRRLGIRLRRQQLLQRLLGRHAGMAQPVTAGQRSLATGLDVPRLVEHLHAEEALQLEELLVDDEHPAGGRLGGDERHLLEQGAQLRDGGPAQWIGLCVQLGPGHVDGRRPAARLGLLVERAECPTRHRSCD
jgi:hypothetical protein